MRLVFCWSCRYVLKCCVDEKGEFRSFMSELHLWMQAWSDQGEQVLARVESVRGSRTAARKEELGKLVIVRVTMDS